MKAEFASAFLRDIRKLRDPTVAEQVRAAILMVEAAPNSRSVANLKKLSGGGHHYRIRVGEYRIGVRIDGDVVTFSRVLPRKEIYRYFP